MTTQEMIAEYNKLTGKNIKKFSSRAAGEAQLAKARAATPKKADPLATLVNEVTKPSATKKPAPSGLYRVVDASKVKRGAFLEFVNAARKLETFSRADLLSTKTAKAQGAAAAYSFAYAVRHGVFGAAK